MTSAKAMRVLAHRLVARAAAIDNRLGPIPGRDADCIAIELLAAAHALRHCESTSDSAALAEIRQLIAEGEFSGDVLLGMVKGIAERGPTRPAVPTQQPGAKP